MISTAAAMVVTRVGAESSLIELCAFRKPACANCNDGRRHRSYDALATSKAGTDDTALDPEKLAPGFPPLWCGK
jgi:hypothetical protein